MSVSKFDLEPVFSNSISLHTLIMHSIYVTYINFCSTKLQMLDSIWVVLAQMFCMLQPTIQHLEKKFLFLYKEYQLVLCYGLCLYNMSSS